MAPERRRWIAKKRHWMPLAFLAAGLAVAVFAYVNPWPNAMLLRAVFTIDGNKTVTEMNKYAPTQFIDAKYDVVYGDRGQDTSFDSFSPASSTGPLPTVIWIHGGAWISGNKDIRDPYARIIANHGYTAISLNYTVAPEATYPTALKQLNQALGYIVDHAAELRVDPNNLVIAGDSAGAQYTAQLATMISSPVYAATVGIAPTLDRAQVRGVILDCGIYDVSDIPNAPGLGGWGFRVALWAYLGTKDWSHTAGGDQMSTIDDVTANFPTTWISGGNADPLTVNQSKPFAAKLTSLGVPVTSLFFPDDTTPELAHEYQFHLDLANAQVALKSTLDFLDKVTANPVDFQ